MWYVAIRTVSVKTTASGLPHCFELCCRRTYRTVSLR